MSASHLRCASARARGEPDTGRRSATCAPGRTCQVSETGDLATWFALSTDVLAVLLLTSAAAVNLVLFRLMVSRR